MDHVTKMRMPPDGMLVSPMNPHWMAHLRFGDLEEAEPPQDHLNAVKATEEAFAQQNWPKPSDDETPEQEVAPQPAVAASADAEQSHDGGEISKAPQRDAAAPSAT
jgi:hypothetical protein